MENVSEHRRGFAFCIIVQGYRPVLEVKEKVSAEGKKTQEVVVGDFEWFTYRQIQEKITNLGSGILHFDLAPANDLGVSFQYLYVRHPESYRSW
jgi:hypothetical protein